MRAKHGKAGQEEAEGEMGAEAKSKPEPKQLR